MAGWVRRQIGRIGGRVTGWFSKPSRPMPQQPQQHQTQPHQPAQKPPAGSAPRELHEIPARPGIFNHQEVKDVESEAFDALQDPGIKESLAENKGSKGPREFKPQPKASRVYPLSTMFRQHRANEAWMVQAAEGANKSERLTKLAQARKTTAKALFRKAAPLLFNETHPDFKPLMAALDAREKGMRGAKIKGHLSPQQCGRIAAGFIANLIESGRLNI